MSTSSPLPQPPDGDQNRAPALLAIQWSFFPVAFALILARIYVRRQLSSFGMDDYWMIAAWVVYTISEALSSISMIKGGARHLYYLKPDQIIEVLKYNFLSQPFGAMASMSGKCSVAFLVLRLIGPNTFWRKWCLYVNVGVYTVITVISIIVTFVQCRPSRALWEPVAGAKCWDPKISADITIFQAAYGTYMDFVLALLPITIIWGLKVCAKKKVGLGLLLSLGIFAGIASAIKTAQLHNLASRVDFTWSVYSIFTWSAIEVSLVIICGSIPTLKPIFDHFHKGKPLKPSRSSLQGRRGYSYRLHPRSKDSGKATLFGRSGATSGNSTNVTAMVDSDLRSAHQTKSNISSDNVVYVEQGVDIVLGGRSLSQNSGSAARGGGAQLENSSLMKRFF